MATAASLLSPGSSAQTVTRQQFESATRIECLFTRKVTTVWDEGAPSVTVDAADFELAFFDIDIEAGSAEAEGRFGDEFIVLRYADGYLHFMQMFRDGPLYVTTIIARETVPGRIMALHSRHEFSPSIAAGFTRLPETYLGDCALQTERAGQSD